MELWSSILVGLLLIVAAWWLVRLHVEGWRELHRRARDMAPEEYDFRRRQLRRRTQTSALLGLIGLGMLIGRLLIVWRAPPTAILAYWAGIVLLVLWLGLLAVADMVATRLYFTRLRRDYLVERARLEAELRRMKRPQEDGEADEQAGDDTKGPTDEPPREPDADAS